MTNALVKIDSVALDESQVLPQIYNNLGVESFAHNRNLFVPYLYNSKSDKELRLSLRSLVAEARGESLKLTPEEAVGSRVGVSKI